MYTSLPFLFDFFLSWFRNNVVEQILKQRENLVQSNELPRETMCHTVTDFNNTTTILALN